ncbi:leucyl/phenylalanyl-tRNA--protein transferase [Methylophaga lonarensis]|uniref:leucyl/phenylalanyl-tRNA--protein transferase n=1 Tax=Methylophaga lonarensis TaxID=999151 RepID=UPI003D2D52D1
MAITWLADQADTAFPPLEHATEHGLLAAGGDLSPTRLITAYQSGIFPWFNRQDPVLWWCPDPRMVLYTDQVNISKSLRKTIRQRRFELSLNQAFTEVMQACAEPRSEAKDDPGTWIHDSMIAAYRDLHQRGYAHSIECWQSGKLVGGLYGVAIGRVFFGESMFSFERDASKVALSALCAQLFRWGFPMIDCQIYSPHLHRMGAENIPRQVFVNQLAILTKLQGPTQWLLDADISDSVYL